MSANDYTSPVSLVEPPSDPDPQAVLVAGALAGLIRAYVELKAEVLGWEDEPSEDELASLHAQASSLTARSSQLGREAREGLQEHLGHGCGHERAFDEVTDFLATLLECGAGLLEVRSAEQIDRGQLAHPFAHLLPMLSGATGQWLLEHCDDEDADGLAELVEHATHTVASLVPPSASLICGPFADEDFSALDEWYQGHEDGEQPSTELAQAVIAELEDLHEAIHEEEAHRFGVGQFDERSLFVEGSFMAELLEPLCERLQELAIGYRLSDHLFSEEGLLLTHWLPGMELPLSRRVLAEDGFAIQLEADELASLRAGGADFDDLAAYLSLDPFPEEADEEAVATLSRLAGWASGMAEPSDLD